MKTAIVILNWNTKGFLEKFLPPLLGSIGPEAEVIVADNASTDGSVELMKEKFPNVGAMFFSKNRGYTGGYNRALMQIKSDYYVLMNSDVEVPEHWLEPLEEWMDSHPECGICAPKLRSYTDRDMFEYAGAAGGYIDKYGYPYCRGRMLKRLEKDCGQYDTPENVFWVSGACLMIRSELFHKLGGLDDRFFAHMEEIDLCWRAQLSGYRVTVIPASTVYHVGGGSLPAGSPKKLYLNYRNNLLMLRKNLGKTLALEDFRHGGKADESASVGERKARRIVHTRMLMDGASAAVYFFTFRWKCLKAVFKAHQDVRKIRIRTTVSDISLYLKEYGRTGSVTGMASRWIIPRAIFCKDDACMPSRAMSSRAMSSRA